MKLPNWLRWLLDMKDDAVEWPPRRAYEWRNGSGASHARHTSLNACLFRLESRAEGRTVEAPDKGYVLSDTSRHLALYVVATGERVDTDLDGDACRLVGTSMVWRLR
jgi:hypothetical protein